MRMWMRAAVFGIAAMLGLSSGVDARVSFCAATISSGEYTGHLIGSDFEPSSAGENVVDEIGYYYGGGGGIVRVMCSQWLVYHVFGGTFFVPYS